MSAKSAFDAVREGVRAVLCPHLAAVISPVDGTSADEQMPTTGDTEHTAREIARGIAARWPYAGNSAHRELLADEIEAALTASHARGLEEAAGIARNGCLVPPDGGSPTDDEREMCDRIADAILALTPSVCTGDGEPIRDAITSALATATSQFITRTDVDRFVADLTRGGYCIAPLPTPPGGDRHGE